MTGANVQNGNGTDNTFLGCCHLPAKRNILAWIVVLIRRDIKLSEQSKEKDPLSSPTRTHQTFNTKNEQSNMSSSGDPPMTPSSVAAEEIVPREDGTKVRRVPKRSSSSSSLLSPRKSKTLEGFLGSSISSGGSKSPSKMSGSRSVGGDMMMAMGETSTRSDGTKGEREKERRKREREKEKMLGVDDLLIRTCQEPLECFDLLRLMDEQIFCLSCRDMPCD